MQVKLQLKIADGTVASSLGYESQVDDAVKEFGVRMYPVNPGTQDSKEATLFYIPIKDVETGQKVVEMLQNHEGVQSASLGG